MDHITLHEDAISGNCYKIRLTAALLGIPLARKAYSILHGDTRTPSFLADVNPNGRIPVLQVGERFLPESNAACWFLADASTDSTLVPQAAFDRADMLHWMFFEQYSHEPNIATLRFWLKYVGEQRLNPAQKAQIPGKHKGGDDALKLMDDHLRTRRFFVGDSLSLADIALYPYTHVANEAGFELDKYGAVKEWCKRIESLPGYVSMSS